jgi:hypothetical protein
MIHYDFSLGGCSPMAAQRRRICTMRGRFISSASTVARPMTVLPRMLPPSSLQRKCRFQLCCRGSNSRTRRPVWGSLGRNLRTLRIIANRACVAQVIRLSLATQYPRHHVIDFERFGAQLLLQLTVFTAELRSLGDNLSKVLWDICRCCHSLSPRYVYFI